MRVFPTQKNLNILDLGCGDGRLVKQLTTDHQVWGIDESVVAVEEANKNGIQARLGNIDDTTIFPAEKFDVILALDILEHLENVDAVLDQIKSSLTPGGCFILSLPNHFDVRTRLDILRGKGIIKWSQREYEKKPWAYAHLRFLLLEDVQQMLAEHGFFPDSIQLNFMSQGLLPTRLIPACLRSALVRAWPNLWSGKFVIRARTTPTVQIKKIILDKTPAKF